MKKFLEQLGAAQGVHEEVPAVTEAGVVYKQIRDKYIKHLGKRALYRSRSTREVRVVTIDAVYGRFVLVSYRHYSIGGEGAIPCTVSLQSLACGDDTLEIEE